MTPEQLEKKRARRRVENMTPEQLEKKRARSRVENMTPEQLEKQRARRRVENMTPEQREKERARSRVENMTPEQLEKKRARDRRYADSTFRLRAGGMYLGVYRVTPEQKAELAEFRANQQNEYREVSEDGFNATIA